MPQWINACGSDDVRAEDVIRFDYNGRTFTMIRSPDDEYFCTDGLCTHEAVHLCDGLVMDYAIECPKHNVSSTTEQARLCVRRHASISRLTSSRSRAAASSSRSAYQEWNFQFSAVGRNDVPDELTAWRGRNLMRSSSETESSDWRHQLLRSRTRGGARPCRRGLHEETPMIIWPYYRTSRAKTYRNFAAEYKQLQRERIAMFKECLTDVGAGTDPEPRHIVPITNEEFETLEHESDRAVASL